MRTSCIRVVLGCLASGFAQVSMADTMDGGVVSNNERVGAASLEAQSASSAGEKQPGGSGRGRSIEEIIVSAQRREERLEEVPISITALTGEQLDSSTDTNMKDTFYRVPGVAPITPSLGSPSISIRGVPFTSGAGGAVGYYVDSVPFGFARLTMTPDMNPYDFDRIEVLRGPQGTLYGANSMSGVIRLLTKAPDPQRFEAKTRVSAASIEDGGENYRADAAVNVPLIEDRLAMRLVGGYQELGGWIDKPFKEDANTGDVKTLRAKLRAQPTDALMLDATAWFSRRSFGAQDLGRDDRTTDTPIEEPSSHDFDTYSLTAMYDFGRVSMTSATSYIDYETHSVISLHRFGPSGYLSPIHIFAEVFSEELTLQSTQEGPWRWSIGVMYRDAKDRVRSEDNLGEVVPGAENLLYSDDDNRSKSSAIFGEATRELANGKVEATLGLRYFYDEFSTVENFRSSFSSPGPLIGEEDTSDALTPRAVLAWHPTDGSTLYVSYAQGFRSGLPQGTATLGHPLFPGSGLSSVKPDKLSNYEIGAKGGLFDGRLSLETALYYMDWQDIKTEVQIGPLIGGLGALVNGSSASGVGVDAAITFRPITGLEIGGNVSWNDLTSDADIFTGGQVLLLKGDRMTWSPETTVNGFVEYSFPFGSLTGYLHGAVNYLSSWKEYSPGRVIFESDSITTTSARFTIESGNGWSVSLFGDNLNDENAAVTSGSGIDIFAARNPPRTVGLQVEYYWN